MKCYNEYRNKLSHKHFRLAFPFYDKLYKYTTFYSPVSILII